MMKKNFLLLVSAFLFAVPFLAAQTLLLPLLKDSASYYYYDQSTGTEQFSGRNYFTYNADNLPLEDLYINFFSGAPTFYRYNYEYNTDKLLTKSTSLRSLVSSTGPWENWLKDDYTYDAQGRNNYYIGQFGNASGGWDNYYQETFWFDDVTPADSSLYELWNNAAGSWDNYRRYSNYYFPSGDLQRHHEDQWDMVDQQWYDQLHEVYTYYPDGKILTKKAISFDVNHQELHLIDSFLYRPDGKLDTTFISNQIVPMAGYNYLIAKSEYDAQGNLSQITTIRKSPDGSTWYPTGRQLFSPGDGYYSNDFSYEGQELYDASSQSYFLIWDIERQFTDGGNGTLLFREERRQNTSQQGQLTTQSIDTVWYHLPTVHTSALAGVERVDCQFANPFQMGNGVVCNSVDQATPLQIRIMNIFGQVVAQGRVMPGEVWRPANDWPSGSYFLTVWQNGKYLGERKMVK